MRTNQQKGPMSKEWNEDEGILSLQEFKPQMPATVSIGLTVAKDPVKREELKKIFISVLRSTASVVDACKICQVPKSLAYVWRTEDPEFAYRWDQIFKNEMLPHLEAEAIRRAMNGSDLMLIFMMKALDRDKYDDKVAEKNVTTPSIRIEMFDVDKSAIAISSNAGNNETIPGVKYLDAPIDGDIIDGQKAFPTTTENKQASEVVITDAPIAGTEGVGKK